MCIKLHCISSRSQRTSNTLWSWQTDAFWLHVSLNWMCSLFSLCLVIVFYCKMKPYFWLRHEHTTLQMRSLCLGYHNEEKWVFLTFVVVIENLAKTSCTVATFRKTLQSLLCLCVTSGNLFPEGVFTLNYLLCCWTSLPGDHLCLLYSGGNDLISSGYVFCY